MKLSAEKERLPTLATTRFYFLVEIHSLNCKYMHVQPVTKDTNALHAHSSSPILNEQCSVNSERSLFDSETSSTDDTRLPHVINSGSGRETSR